MLHETFTEWRSQLTTKHAENVATLAAARAELEEKTAATAEAKAEKRALQAAFERLAPHDGLAGSLHRLVSHRLDELGRADGELNGARMHVENATRAVRNTIEALAQLDIVSGATAADEADGEPLLTVLA